MPGISNKIVIVGLTETSEKEDIGFIRNVKMVIKNSIQLSHQKGGTDIYVNKYFDSFERIDLNIISLQYESTWIEIKNKRRKNTDYEYL